jgi:hypothetical protein
MIDLLLFLISIGIFIRASDFNITWKWLFVHTILFFVLFNRNNVFSYKFYGSIQIIDICLLIMIGYIYKQIRLFNKSTWRLYSFRYLILFVFLSFISVLLTYLEIGYQDGLLQILRNRIIILVSFLFFSTISLRPDAIDRIIATLKPILILLSIYTIIYPLLSKSTTGIVSDINVGGWNRTGAYILVPAACYFPVLLIERFKNTQWQSTFNIIIVLSAIILTISKSTILTFIYATALYLWYDWRNISISSYVQKYGFATLIISLLIVILPGIYNVQNNYYEIFLQRLQNGIEELGFSHEDDKSWRGYELMQLQRINDVAPVFGRAYDRTLYHEVGYLNNKRVGYEMHAGSLVHTGVVIMIWQGGYISVFVFLLMLMFAHFQYRKYTRATSLNYKYSAEFIFALAWLSTQLMLNDFSWHYGAIIYGLMLSIFSLIINNLKLSLVKI